MAETLKQMIGGMVSERRTGRQGLEAERQIWTGGKVVEGRVAGEN
jgi:hypothetical protein